jgi:hypothetical protein
VLDRFSHFGLPLHFTENTLISGEIMPAHIEDLNDWQVESWPSTPEGEERQAREVGELYDILFAHPRVEAVTTWDATDGRWLKAPAGLLRADDSIKPVYEALKQRITGDWRTTAETRSGANGELSFEGFRGTYEAAVKDKRAVFVLDGKSKEINLTLG